MAWSTSCCSLTAGPVHGSPVGAHGQAGGELMRHQHAHHRPVGRPVLVAGGRVGGCQLRGVGHQQRRAVEQKQAASQTRPGLRSAGHELFEDPVAHALHHLPRQFLPCLIIGSGVAGQRAFAKTFAGPADQARRQLTDRLLHGRHERSFGVQALDDHQPNNDHQAVNAIVEVQFHLGSQLIEELGGGGLPIQRQHGLVGWWRVNGGIGRGHRFHISHNRMTTGR